MKSNYFLYGAILLWVFCLIPTLAPFTALFGFLSFVVSVLISDQPNNPTERVNE